MNQNIRNIFLKAESKTKDLFNAFKKIQGFFPKLVTRITIRFFLRVGDSYET